jgi:hypothetical protein
LHSVDKASAVAVSEGILPGIFVTSYDGAQTIVQAGDADPSGEVCLTRHTFVLSL